MDAVRGPVHDLVLVGPGQLGRLFAGGALAYGLRVTPVRRGDDAARIIASAPGAPILIAVGERDLERALDALPPTRRRDAILVQNDRFPADWRPFVAEPTVAVVWLNAKPGQPLQVARPTAVHGPHARVLCALHEPLGVPCRVLDGTDTLGDELVAKYAFIVAVNALGVRSDETVGAWLARDAPLVRRLLDDGRRLGEARLGRPVRDAAATTGIGLEAMRALASMPARGRSARARVERALAQGRSLGVAFTALATLPSG